MSIQDEAMTANLHIGTWTGYKLDRNATSSLTSSAGADDDAARVNKHLVAKDTLKGVVQAVSALRAHFISRTLPWKDNGDRLLPRAMYFQYMSEYEEKSRAFRNAADEFVDKIYPRVRETAQVRMGDLFNSDDYPSADALRHRFYVNIDIDAITVGGDFRVAMEASERAKIQSDVEHATRQRLAELSKEISRRTFHLLRALVESLEEGHSLRQATFDNAVEWCALLPRFNVADDERLSDIAERLAPMFIGLGVDMLRRSAGLRKDIRERLSPLLRDLAEVLVN